MSKTALVFTHEPMEGPALFGDILEEQDFKLQEIFTPRADLHDIDPLSPDLLLVMGGTMGVYEAGRHPFLLQEMKILKARLEKDLPTLGICLGAQLMAGALGAAVFKGPQGPEIGWHPLTLTPEGEDHPVQHLGAAKTNMFHWHGDTFDLPPDAKLLASSRLYDYQAYQIGRCGLGLQCHPEVQDAQGLIEWYDVMAAKGEITADYAALLREQTAQHIENLKQQSRRFFLAWLAAVGFDLKE